MEDKPHHGIANLKSFADPEHAKKANRNGRPKGSRNRSTIYKQWLEKEGKYGKKVDDIVVAAIEKAEEGDIAALKELMDGAYGKIPDKVLQADIEAQFIEDDMVNDVLSLLTDEQLQQLIDKRRQRDDSGRIITHEPVAIGANTPQEQSYTDIIS